MDKNASSSLNGWNWQSKHRLGKLAALWCIVNALPGCALIDPARSPVIDSRLTFGLFGGQDVATFALTADRRIVVMQVPGDPTQPIQFCAEPPPDVAQALRDELSASLEASAQSIASVADPSVKAELTRKLAISVLALTQRSQGLQFYRDGMFYYCQALINRNMSNEQFAEKEAALRQAAATLIGRQLDNLPALLSLTASSGDQAKP